jgi:hypothetical protein
MTVISDRYSINKTDNLQHAYFNGVGWEAWENIWGSWNGIVPADGEALRRSAHILRHFGRLGFTQSPGWEPHAPEVLQSHAVFGSRWPVGEETLWTLVNRGSRNVSGVPTSLLDLGYNYIGLDDGYQACGQGVNGSFYTSDGDPVINTTKFPNLAEMVATAHGMGLKAGWYLNNCICNPFKPPSEVSPEFATQVLRGTVRALREASFDAVKLDSCGPNMNATAWYDEINRTGADPVLIDLCHTGHDGPGSSDRKSVV